MLLRCPAVRAKRSQYDCTAVPDIFVDRWAQSFDFERVDVGRDQICVGGFRAEEPSVIAPAVAETLDLLALCRPVHVRPIGAVQHH